MFEELEHDSRDAPEMTLAKAALEDRAELGHVDPGLESGRVHLVGGRREHEVDTGLARDVEIASSSRG